MNYKVEKGIKRKDERGILWDFLKGDEVDPSIDRSLGQIYVVTFAKIGVVRGNHYHKTKNEWFVVIRGEVEMRLVDIKSKESIDRIINGKGDEYQRIFVGKNIAHAFKSRKNNTLMVNYADKPYHMENPDTYKYIIA